LRDKEKNLRASFGSVYSANSKKKLTVFYLGRKIDSALVFPVSGNFHKLTFFVKSYRTSRKVLTYCVFISVVE